MGRTGRTREMHLFFFVFSDLSVRGDTAFLFLFPRQFKLTLTCLPCLSKRKFGTSFLSPPTRGRVVVLEMHSMHIHTRWRFRICPSNPFRGGGRRGVF